MGIHRLSAPATYRPYTVLLLVYGGLSLAWAAVLQAVVPSLDPILQIQPALNGDLHLFFGTAALFVALLRRARGVAALPASTALVLGLGIDFPVGSALAVYWLTRVRRIERQPPSREKTVDLYTTGLYVAGLGFALTMVAFQSLLPGLHSADLFGILAVVYGGLGLLLTAVATLRCLSRSWGYFATFGLNVLLAPLCP